MGRQPPAVSGSARFPGRGRCDLFRSRRRHPLDELAVALAGASGPGADWRKLKDDLLHPDPARTLADFANDLRVRAGAGEAQILIPIDQAEELFGVADPDEARRFLEILS